MRKKQKYTTIALEENQYLKIDHFPLNSYLEVYMLGYTDNKRDRTLDGYYMKSKVKRKVD